MRLEWWLDVEEEDLMVAREGMIFLRVGFGEEDRFFMFDLE